jgi:1-acyl-sn-glycerol-3-phosphate acyltransferase
MLSPARAIDAQAPAAPRAPDLSGFDRPYYVEFLRKCQFLLESVFRMEVTGLEHLRFEKPGILAGNHNWGLWGITEVLGLSYAWYHQQPQPAPDLIGQGGPELQKIPLLRTLVRRAGIVVASMQGMVGSLQEGRWVLIQPGAVVDQGRPIWQRRRSRMKKVSWLGPQRVLTDQLAYVAAAAEGGYPIYPVAWSGTHELAPILWESTRLLHWTGTQRMRREENLPSFPITLNHFINLAVFLATPLRKSALGWLGFTLLNIYFDPVFSYPIFPFKLRIKIGAPIEIPNLSRQRLPLAERQAIYREIHQRITREVDAMLTELDEGRPWVRPFDAAATSLQKLRHSKLATFFQSVLTPRGRRPSTEQVSK